jgi:hypothetical protein
LFTDIVEHETTLARTRFNPCAFLRRLKSQSSCNPKIKAPRASRGASGRATRGLASGGVAARRPSQTTWHCADWFRFNAVDPHRPVKIGLAPLARAGSADHACLFAVVKLIRFWEWASFSYGLASLSVCASSGWSSSRSPQSLAECGTIGN